MHFRMVKFAQQRPVVDVGAPGRVVLVFPRHHMMTLTPGGWPIASSPHTPSIASGECPVLRCGEEPTGLAVPQYLPVLTHQSGDEVAMADQLLEYRRGNGLVDAVDPPHPGAVRDVVECHLHIDRGSCPVDVRHS